jgi:AP-2 complex subunit alpha
LQQSGTSRPVVRKKAALCLLRLMRKTPADAQLVSADTFAPVMAQLLEERDVGLLLSCVTLLLGICARTGGGASLYSSTVQEQQQQQQQQCICGGSVYH